MAEESFQEKTEQATPKRREDARQKGQVARSSELTSVAILMAGLLSLSALGAYMYRHLTGFMVDAFVNSYTFGKACSIMWCWIRYEIGNHSIESADINASMPTRIVAI